MNTKKIICWGDSITVGMSMKSNQTYPSVLGRLLGDEYTVINAGGGGETAQTIASRQGAYKVYTSRDIVFEARESVVDISADNYKTAFCLEDGTLLNVSTHPNPFAPYEFESDLVYIDNEEYFLPKNGKFSALKRNRTDCKTVIKKGSEVAFLSALEQQKGSFCEIFYIGTNGRVYGVPKQENIDFLINENEKMIQRHGNDCWLVVIPYWDGYYSRAFVDAFGERAVDFRKELLKSGFSEEGLFPTKDDIIKMGEGLIPPSFRLNNNPNEIHLNKYGYSFLAKMLYERGKTLGFW